MLTKTRADELQQQVTGVVFSPGDVGYAEEIAAFNLAVQHRPDIVVGIESAHDAQAAIQYAAANDIKIAVQSTGHGAYTPVTSGMMISTRRLNDVRIDPVSRTASVGAGVRWRAVLDVAAEHGLAPIIGSSPTVGVAGLLLGGGIGPLSRSHGFGSDYLEQVTLVTGRGEIITVNRDQRPDLLWALRGGKYGFGVVTELVVRLVELPSLYGGFLMFEEENIETAFRSWVDWTATADPKVTTSVAIIDFPPVEFVPEALRGRKMLNLRFAYPGDSEAGERLAAPLRAFAPAFMDTIAEMPPTEIARIHNDPADPLPTLLCGRLLTHIDQEFASILLHRVGAGQHPPIIVAEIRHLGSAARRDVPEGSAAGGRQAEFAFFSVAGNPALFAVEVPQFVDQLLTEIGPWTSPENHINYIGAASSEEDYVAAWPPEFFAKLEDLRRDCDPQGLFAPAFSLR